jgi:hypothetical protein
MLTAAIRRPFGSARPQGSNLRTRDCFELPRTLDLLDAPDVGFVGFDRSRSQNSRRNRFACWIFVGFRGALNVRSHPAK